MFELLVIACIFLYVLHKATQHKLAGEMNKMFPGPRPWPIIGNVLEAIGNEATLFQRLLMTAETYTETFCLWMGPKLYLAVGNPEDAEAVLGSSTALDKADLYRFLRPWMGQGLITSQGDKWKHNRKLLTPAFHYSILENFVEVFDNNDEILVKKLSQHDGGPHFDVLPYIKLYAMDNICETSMGVKISAQDNPTSQYVQAMHSVLGVIRLRCIWPWLHLDSLFNLSPYGAQSRSAIKVLHDFTDDVIAKRKLEVKHLNAEEEFKEHNVKQRLAFLDILLDAARSGGLSDDDIRDEVNTFMFAGQDTITSSLSFAVFNLADHAEFQEKVYREQYEIFGESTRAPSFRELQEMKYLEQVVKESLRVHPGVSVIGRRVSKEFQLSGGRYIPEGTEVMLSITSIHRNPRHWPQPAVFNPDNFAAEVQQKRHPYAFVPFSAGPRNCIGQKYAMLEMKSALSVLLRRFYLLPPDNPADRPILVSDLTLNSQNGINIKLKSRLE